MIYFDNAASSGVKPAAVAEAVADALKNLSANPGRGGHKLALAAARTVCRTRADAAEFFGLDNPENVIFTANCTAALNLAVFGTQAKGHVITTANEHNSVIRPLYELERRGLIRITVLPPNESGTVTAESIARSIRTDTYLIAVNHVSNVTGAVAPITEIGRLAGFKNIPLLVDGAQSAGHLKIDMRASNISMLAVAPHKGLGAPQGIGMLLFADGVTLKPILFGGTGTESENPYQPLISPEAYESGTLNTPGIAGLRAALAYTAAHMHTHAEILRGLSLRLYDGLKKIKNVRVYSPRDTAAGVISFNIGDLPSGSVSDILNDEYDICTRPGLHCAPLIHKHLGTISQGAVRASLSAYNNAEEAAFFLTAVKEIADHPF